MGEIKTRTSTTIVKNKIIKLKTSRRENKTCKDRNSKGIMLIMDYFLKTLFISVDDDGWYVNFEAIMHLFYNYEWFRDFKEILFVKSYL